VDKGEKVNNNKNIYMMCLVAVNVKRKKLSIRLGHTGSGGGG
jgi:hypothetical protein